MLKISEKSVCFNCSKKSGCKLFEESFVPPEVKSKKIEEKINGNMTDLQIILNGIYKIANRKESNKNPNEDLDIKYINTEGENIDEEAINTSKENLKRNSLVTKISSSNSKNMSDSRKVTANFTIEDPIFKRISNKEWSSASILTEIINETMEDFLNNNGIAFRTLFNAYLETKKEDEQIELLAKEKLIEENQKDPIVKLLEDLKKCRNRKDKRRLLAKYNKTANFGWGEYFKINKKVDEYAKEAESATENVKRDEDILYKEKMKNNNNNNTVVITESKLKRINTAKNVAPIKTLSFSQKLSDKTAKKKYLESAQSLSLLSNQARDGNSQVEDRTFVKIPGKDMNRVVRYLNSAENDEGAVTRSSSAEIKKFNSFIEEKKRENTIDIGTRVRRKLGKLDKKLEENKKFTLTPLLAERNDNLNMISERERHLELVNDDRRKFQALEEFSTKIQNDNESFLIENSSHSTSMLSVVRNQEKKKDEIVFEKISNLNEDQSINGELTFYKQKNLTKEEKIKKKQFASQINKIIENKHIYKSQNFYNNTNMENIPYETDSDISRTIRFEKTIKKEDK